MKRIVTIIGLLSITITSIFYMSRIENSNIVSYKEYKMGNNNQILNKILNDNTLQKEKENMFNYASNGAYYDASSSSQSINPEYVTNGLYSMEDEDGTSYYFRGNINNNNVQFGEYENDYYVYQSNISYYQSEDSCKQAGNETCTQVKLASKGDKMYWKIIRVNGDGSLRLIYNGTSINPDNSSDDIYGKSIVGITPYNLNYDNKKYAGYTYDRDTNEIDSFVKKEVDTWYKNTLGSNSNYDSKIINGRFCSDSSVFLNQGKLIYFSSFNRLGQVSNNYQKPNSPTLKCPSTSENYGGTYNLKAGLITGDEIALAGESLEVTSNSYLNSNIRTRVITMPFGFWSMTPIGYFDSDIMPVAFNNIDTYAAIDTSSSIVLSHNIFLILDDVILPNGIRPVINLSKDLGIEGNGTADNPYVIVEKNKHNGVITIEINNNIDLINAFDNINIPDGVTWTSADPSIAVIENGKILGLKEGQTVITGISSDGLTTYEIKVTVLKNPVTMSSIYIVIGLIVIIGLGTTLYLYYKKKFSDL